MPGEMAGMAAVYGGSFALIGICWIIFNLIFLYRLTLQAGLFKILQESIGAITNDRRLQLLLIAFCFGAFFEGAAGGGTPVAVTGAILIGLGVTPLAASGLALIANTAPVAFGGLGTPIIVRYSGSANQNRARLWWCPPPGCGWQCCRPDRQDQGLQGGRYRRRSGKVRARGTSWASMLASTTSPRPLRPI